MKCRSGSSFTLVSPPPKHTSHQVALLTNTVWSLQTFSKHQWTSLDTTWFQTTHLVLDQVYFIYPAVALEDTRPQMGVKLQSKYKLNPVSMEPHAASTDCIQFPSEHNRYLDAWRLDLYQHHTIETPWCAWPCVAYRVMDWGILVFSVVWIVIFSKRGHLYNCYRNV